MWPYSLILTTKLNQVHWVEGLFYAFTRNLSHVKLHTDFHSIENAWRRVISMLISLAYESKNVKIYLK